MPRPARNDSDRVAASRQVLMAAGLRLAARRLRRQLSTAARRPRRGAPAASAIVALVLDDRTAGLRPQREIALAADPGLARRWPGRDAAGRRSGARDRA